MVLKRRSVETCFLQLILSIKVIIKIRSIIILVIKTKILFSLLHYDVSYRRPTLFVTITKLFSACGESYS